MNLLYWVVLLILQNAAFTWVSRARNGGSYGYHAVAAIFSNGIFFAAQTITITLVVLKGLQGFELVKIGLIYIIATVIGSVLMHWISVNYLEKGKRKVGSS